MSKKSRTVVGTILSDPVARTFEVDGTQLSCWSISLAVEIDGKKRHTEVLIVEPEGEMTGLYAGLIVAIEFAPPGDGRKRRRRVASGDTLSVRSIRPLVDISDLLGGDAA